MALVARVDINKLAGLQVEMWRWGKKDYHIGTRLLLPPFLSWTRERWDTYLLGEVTNEGGKKLLIR